MKGATRLIVAGLTGFTALVLLLAAFVMVPKQAGDAKVWLPSTPAERQVAAVKKLRDEMQPVPWWRLW